MKTPLHFLVLTLYVFFISAFTHAFAQDSTMQQPPQQQPTWSGSDGTIETLFGEKAPFVFVPTLKATSLGNGWGTMLGVYGGAQISKNILIGLGTYSTFSHPSVNMGYTGLMVEYRYTPYRLLHIGGSLLAGYGAASRSFNAGIRPFGIIENVGRLFTPQFFVLEPSVFGEVNLNTNLSASLGASYRWAGGLSETLSSTQTGLTNAALSGVAINLGMRFRID